MMKWWRRVRKAAPGDWPGRWQDRVFIGHINIGRRVTIYGANAMHWAVNIRMLGTYVCFHPTTRTFNARWPWYFYVSPNATPWAATFKRGAAE